ncbi:acyltransferase family protein [Marivita sp. GX14005]|uniref:acyltransferase family protein n=1 Tax=Marivita sp. GX14005 TaxID=2942276 RepID=UPI002019814D|nr:acyltransferase [Marivita sp. GX14005]
MKPTGHIAYRPDIDGLRALAVLPVVLFHADVSGLSGGFVGVDIFFVISGFLITSIIHREIAAGTFSIRRFYERRARRILPALTVVMAATLALGYWLLMPSEYEDTARAAISASLFVSNILFWTETGYFSPGIYDQPLLHTWSLAIEEQFYIFFPPLMMLLAAFRRGALRWIAALTILSFALSALTTQMRPDMGYYLLPWRAWELGVGSLIALSIADMRFSRKVLEVMGFVGFGLIAYAVFIFDKTTVFPGAAAMIPVAGAALLIVAGKERDTLSFRLLSLAPLVWIGLISYSLYLWHWPVIVFYQQITLDRPDLAGCLIVFSVSILLAWASWAFVERPFRKPVGRGLAGWELGRPEYVLGAGVLSVPALSLIILQSAGLPGRLPAEAVRLASFSQDRHPSLRDCTARWDAWRAPSDPCLFGASGDAGPDIAIWGDSHAAALLPEVEAAAIRNQRRLAYLSRSGCLPVPDTERLDGKTGRCNEYGTGALDYLIRTDSIGTVILVSRYAMASRGYLTDYGLAERDWGPTVFADAQTGRWPEDRRLERLMDKFDSTVARLRAAGRDVVIVYPVPEIGHKVPETLAKLSLHGRTPERFGLSQAAFDARNADVIAALDTISARYDAERIVPHDALCSEGHCAVIRNGIPLYYDDDHLSSAGAALFGPQFDRIMARPRTDTLAEERCGDARCRLRH